MGKKKSATKPKKQTRKKSRLHLNLEQGILLGLVSAAAFCVGFSLMLDSMISPEADAKKTIAQLADDYYIEYLYPSMLGAYLNEPEKILKSYTERGLPTTRLRQLLQYTGVTNMEAARQVSNRYYHCDSNLTTLRFYPVAPFGPKDYKVQYNYSCDDTIK